MGQIKKHQIQKEKLPRFDNGDAEENFRDVCMIEIV